MDKLNAVARRCDQETAEYAALHANIDKRVAEAEADVTQLRIDLAAAQKQRELLVQYERIAIGVNVRPPRAALEA